MDEKITANEWNKRKQCPICKDIAEKNIPLDGELMTGLKGEPLPCPMCGHTETRLFHNVVVEPFGYPAICTIEIGTESRAAISTSNIGRLCAAN